MDEKTLGLLLKWSVTTDKCLDGVETALNALVKQSKINRKQKAINIILFGLTISCVSNIADLIKMVRNQNAKIEELENKLKGEGPTEKKGE